MQKLSLEAVAREQLEAARRGQAGRAARTVVGGHEHVLRQTVIALLAGRSLADHDDAARTGSTASRSHDPRDTL